MMRLVVLEHLHLRRGAVVVQAVPHVRHWPLRSQCLRHDAIKVLSRQASTSVTVPRVLHTSSASAH
jgi:hypothetical protein